MTPDEKAEWINGPEKMAEEQRNKPVDWTYSEGCGCQVTFFAASGYHTSRMLPGQTCARHTQAPQVVERDKFVASAKAGLAEYRRRLSSKFSQCANCGCEVRTDAEAFLHALLHSGNVIWSEWGQADKLNALPFIFFPIVAKAMEEYKRHI